MRYQYVLLGYTRDVLSKQGTVIALISRPLDASTVDIQVQRATEWRSLVHPTDLLYVEEVLREAAEDTTFETFEALSDLSVGCLRTNAAGVLTSDSAPQIDQITA